jgi:hypothetical protein
LEDKKDQIKCLKVEAVQMKVSFADTVLSLKSSESSPSPSLLSGPTYASVTRSASCKSTLVAKCIDDQASGAKLDLLEVEKLLDTSNSGLIPSHVRFKNSKMFVTLENDVAVAKAADILNKKPEFQSRFNPASKLNVLYPVVALFVNVSDLDSLKKELEHRNSLLRGQIHSLRTIFTKPNTTEGHVKLFLRSKLVRENVLRQKKVSILGTDFRIVPIDLDREVRRCFKCQKYGHIQLSCPSNINVCGKCSGQHRTSECSAESSNWKCVNCKGPHQTGDKSCPEQVKAVSRYRTFLDSNE